LKIANVVDSVAVRASKVRKSIFGIDVLSKLGISMRQGAPQSPPNSHQQSTQARPNHYSVEDRDLCSGVQRFLLGLHE
jgi:hypothetical protein